MDLKNSFIENHHTHLFIDCCACFHNTATELSTYGKNLWFTMLNLVTVWSFTEKKLVDPSLEEGEIWFLGEMPNLGNTSEMEFKICVD